MAEELRFQPRDRALVFPFWKRKGRGGLTCSARREGVELVLAWPDAAPRSRANT